MTFYFYVDSLTSKSILKTRLLIDYRCKNGPTHLLIRKPYKHDENRPNFHPDSIKTACLAPLTPQTNKQGKVNDLMTLTIKYPAYKDTRLATPKRIAKKPQT